VDAYLASLSVHLPDGMLTNEQLQLENPAWDMRRLEAKTGIKTRRIAAAGETASDLAFQAAEKLLDGLPADRNSIDACLFCTQSPDYFLPTSACILQDRLGLPTTCAALDFNQGCSGYVYGLYLAKALVASGTARNVLVLTGETYSKYIHPRDRSVRVLFGDAGSASLVTARPPGAKLGPFRVGTDGSGHQSLIVPAGGSRLPCGPATAVESTDEQGCQRTDENLFMDGQELFLFTLQRIPALVRSLVEDAGTTIQDVDWFIFHQANLFMNEHLRGKLCIPSEKAPFCMQHVGNTVSNTIPIALQATAERMAPEQKVVLVGFGVGYSWAACLLQWGSVGIS